MNARPIRLGYAVGSGVPVDIPLKHMVITGQTQEAGKTTTLEALIERSGLRAVTFITKRGEGSFTGARRSDPYFREQADWQFVASLLEASRGEKLKFERAWIIRASKGARTLADVQCNVRAALQTAKGMSADVYLTLDAYLDAVVPQIAAVRWAPAVTLGPGVNAVDLTALHVEMQHLVIRSTLDWLLARERDTVVVVPEAWKFLPQGRGTPVKLAAEAFIRQGATLRNFLWLDSQDIAGVEKIILKSCALWILGVQREMNEIKRTLDNIPASTKKPTAADVAQLELGQFYACWGPHAIKTYVQPVWLIDDLAQKVATGVLSADAMRRAAAPEMEESMTHEDVARLTRENEQLRVENAELRRRLEALEPRHDEPGDGAGDVVPRSVARARARAIDGVASGDTAGASVDPGAVANATFDAIKARLLADAATDPAILRLLATRPELEVRVARRILETSDDTLRGRIAKLIAEGFFAVPRAGTAIESELRAQAFACSRPNCYREADKLATEGFLRKVDGGYQIVPGAHVRVLEPA